ncbi:GSCOCG00012576001-RA-CDS, partial [Cotesia congregata]
IPDFFFFLRPVLQKITYESFLQFHEKYNFKSRSDNEPHIFSVADKAYQDVLHNEEPQHIIIAGESYSGKTFNVINLVNHFMYLGK